MSKTPETETPRAAKTNLDLSKFTFKVWKNVAKAILLLSVVITVLVFLITLVARINWSIIQFVWSLW